MRQLDMARKCLIAPLISDLIDMYHTDKMADGTINLLRWWQCEKNMFAKKFAEKKNYYLKNSSSLEKSFPLYYDWRRLKDYYWKCWRYRKSGTLSNNEIKAVMTTKQAALYLHIIEPIGIAADENFSREISEMLILIFPESIDIQCISDNLPAPL